MQRRKLLSILSSGSLYLTAIGTATADTNLREGNKERGPSGLKITLLIEETTVDRIVSNVTVPINDLSTGEKSRIEAILNKGSTTLYGEPQFGGQIHVKNQGRIHEIIETRNGIETVDRYTIVAEQLNSSDSLAHEPTIEGFSLDDEEIIEKAITLAKRRPEDVAITDRGYSAIYRNVDLSQSQLVPKLTHTTVRAEGDRYRLHVVEQPIEEEKIEYTQRAVYNSPQELIEELVIDLDGRSLTSPVRNTLESAIKTGEKVEGYRNWDPVAGRDTFSNPFKSTIKTIGDIPQRELIDQGKVESYLKYSENYYKVKITTESAE